MLSARHLSKVYFIVFISGISLNSHAAAIGSPDIFKLPKITTPKGAIQTDVRPITQIEPKAQLGLGMKLSRVSVSDDFGVTNKAVSTEALGVYFTNSFPHSFSKFIPLSVIKQTRYLSELYVGNYAFEADSTHIGQEVTQLGFRFSLQKKVILVNHFAPLLGLGLDFSNTNFKKRHAVDSEGFLINESTNKTSQRIGLSFNVMKTWPAYDEMDVAAKFEYTFPAGGELSRASLGFILFFGNDSGHSSFVSDAGPKK